MKTIIATPVISQPLPRGLAHGVAAQGPRPKSSSSPNNLMHRFLLTLVILLTLALTSARAEDVVAYYIVNQTGIARDFFVFGYTPEGGSFTPLDGNQIVSANLTIDYRPAAGEDINNLFIGMAVPTDAATQFFGVMGTDFTMTAPGLFHYDLTTDAFNGTIRAGSFGLETYSLIDGEGMATDGQYLEGSGFRYTVALPAVPEPSTWAMMVVGGLGMMGLVQRRTRRVA